MEHHYRIREARAGDVRAVAAIERVSFSDPWSERAIDAAGGSTLVAEWGGCVAGYVICALGPGEGEVLNLAVHPDFRRRGLGRELLRAALSWMSERGAEEVFLEVRESNREARALYEGERFSVVGIRPEYYRHPLEDAVVLRRFLPVEEGGAKNRSKSRIFG